MDYFAKFKDLNILKQPSLDTYSLRKHPAGCINPCICLTVQIIDFTTEMCMHSLSQSLPWLPFVSQNFGQERINTSIFKNVCLSITLKYDAFCFELFLQSSYEHAERLLRRQSVSPIPRAIMTSTSQTSWHYW